MYLGKQEHHSITFFSKSTLLFSTHINQWLPLMRYIWVAFSEAQFSSALKLNIHMWLSDVRFACRVPSLKAHSIFRVNKPLKYILMQPVIHLAKLWRWIRFTGFKHFNIILPNTKFSPFHRFLLKISLKSYQIQVIWLSNIRLARSRSIFKSSNHYRKHFIKLPFACVDYFK